MLSFGSATGCAGLTATGESATSFTPSFSAFAATTYFFDASNSEPGTVTEAAKPPSCRSFACTRASLPTGLPVGWPCSSASYTPTLTPLAAPWPWNPVPFTSTSFDSASTLSSVAERVIFGSACFCGSVTFTGADACKSPAFRAAPSSCAAPVAPVATTYSAAGSSVFPGTLRTAVNAPS